MLLLGILALIQTIFLPGILILYFANIKIQSIVQKYIYVFALSLFANYSLVTILVLSKIYISAAMFTIIIAEVLLIIFLCLKKRISILGNSNLNQAYQSFRVLLKQNNLHIKVLIIGASIVFLFYFSLFISNIGTIFYFTDTVNNVHWNTWALDFANNILPIQSSHFPQLIPANWSISYLLIGGSNIHFFPKSIMPLFFLGNILMFWDLAITKRNYVYLIALIVYGLFGPIIYNLVFIADGNGDLPVSFFAFLSFYAYLKRNENKYDLREYILIFLFASTAAGTKLAGFYIFVLISALCLYHLIVNYKSLKTSDYILLISSVITILGANLFWYYLKPNVMVSSLHQPEWLAKNYYDILSNALHLIYYNLGLPVVAFFILTIGFSLLDKRARWISIIMVIPPIVLWMFKYSSDFRNLSFVVPFLAYVSSFGLVKIIEIAKNKKLDLTINFDLLQEKIFPGNLLKAGLYAIIFPVIIFFVINTNTFYKILYDVYSSINKYYFQSNRITYFTDFTSFVHVDYYQKVLAVMFLLIAAFGILYLLKIKLQYFFVLILFSATVLNFTFITESQIVQHQQNEFDKVDARNYYFRINTILQSAKLYKQACTNFKAICTEKIPREIEFDYLDNKTVEDIFDRKYSTRIKTYFLKLDYLQEQTKFNINKSITAGRFNVLYDDKEYLLISSINLFNKPIKN
jgi:hypothetical protein